MENLEHPRHSLRGLRTFCVVARHGSIQNAAEELFLTASAVSHQIKNLEEELGGPLFIRTPRPLRLTDAGQALFDALDPLILEIDKVVSGHRAHARHSLRISVQPFFASELFVPRLPEFAAEHPEIELHLETSNESSEQHPRTADVSIRLFSTPPAGLVADLLVPFRLLPAGAPAFRDRLEVDRGRIISDFPLLVHDVRVDAWRRWSEQSGIALPERPKTTRLDSMSAVVRAAEQGMGAALVPLPLADAWLQSGALVPLFDVELDIDDGYYLVSDPKMTDDPAVRALRAWAIRIFSEQPEAPG